VFGCGRDRNGLLMGGNVARIWAVLAWGIAGSLGVTLDHAVYAGVGCTARCDWKISDRCAWGLRCGESLFGAGGWLLI
jgi:hypothetical protein